MSSPAYWDLHKLPNPEQNDTKETRGAKKHDDDGLVTFHLHYGWAKHGYFSCEVIAVDPSVTRETSNRLF